MKRRMDLLGKARRLESTIARRFDRAARDAVGAVTREPLEIVHLVVEAVEHEIQPGGRGKRVFPFNSITLSVLAPSREERARFEAVSCRRAPLRDRIVEHLRSKSCPIDDLTLDVAYVARAPKDWRHPQFNLAFARVARAAASEARREPAFARIDLTVVRGTAERKTYSFAAKRIDLGRCAEVRDTRNRLIPDEPGGVRRRIRRGQPERVPPARPSRLRADLRRRIACATMGARTVRAWFATAAPWRFRRGRSGFAFERGTSSCWEKRGCESGSTTAAGRLRREA